MILVEGRSDRAALEALAERRGRDLAAERISIEPMGGATNIERFLRRLGPHGLGLRLAGLCDAAEERHFRRALERAGFGPGPSRAGRRTSGMICLLDWTATPSSVAHGWESSESGEITKMNLSLPAIAVAISAS